MKRSIKHLSLLAATTLIALPLGFTAVQADSYKIDDTHAHAAFSVTHLGFSTTYGQFKAIEGSFEFDETAPEKSTVEVTIQTKSVDTANDDRDKHIRGTDFFDVEKFPTMTFKSTGIEITGDKTGNMTGDLTLHGVTKPVTLAVTFNKVGPHPFKKEIIVAGFNATGELDRTDFDMNYASPLIGNMIPLIISVEGRKQ